MSFEPAPTPIGKSMTHPPMSYFAARSIRVTTLFASVILGLSATGQTASTPSGQEILRKTLQLYGSAKYYQCKARLNSESIAQPVSFPDSDTWERRFTVYHFDVEYHRDRSFNSNWKQARGGFHPFHRNSLWSLSTLGSAVVDQSRSGGEATHYNSLYEAMDATEFGTGTFFTLLREFLDPAFHGDLLANRVQLTGTKRVSGRQCYALKLSGYRHMRIWIDSESLIVRKIEYRSDRDQMTNQIAWLHMKLDQARQNNNPDAERIERRLDKMQRRLDKMQRRKAIIKSYVDHSLTFSEQKFSFERQG